MVALLKAKGLGVGRGIRDTWARPLAGNAGSGQGRAQAPGVPAKSGRPQAQVAAKDPKAAMYAKGRMKAGEMNGTEQAYHDHLTQRQHAGEIAWFKFEGMTFKLADDTRYTPDFMVMLADGQLQAHEVKGYWTDDARVKTKVAASLFPIEFIAIKKKAKKDGGGWDKEVF
ncbi:DUF1064 domain-containing protein [Comamonas sp. Z1]|nr:DUF1064 domain-containing protein [Comamonas sp. Z1]